MDIHTWHDKQEFEHKIVIIFLSTWLNMCHWDNYFEYLQVATTYVLVKK